MSTTEYPRAPLPDLTHRSAFVSVSDYLDGPDWGSGAHEVRAAYSPPRNTDAAHLEAAVTAYIGLSSIHLPPDVWRIVIGVVEQALAQADADAAAVSA